MKSVILALALISAAYTGSPPQACASCLSGFQCMNDFACGQGCLCVHINGPGRPGVCA